MGGTMMGEFEVFASRERYGWAEAEKFDSYVDIFGPISARFARSLVNLTDVKDADVLDLCCGHGAMTAELIRCGARVTGLDFSPEGLSRARLQAPDASFVEGDAQSMEFEDDSFDVVLCNLGLLHVPDRQKALSEVRRVLRPDGLFGNSSWATPDDNPAFRTALTSIRPNIHPDSPPPAQPDIFEFGAVESATSTLETAGFTVESTALVEATWRFQDPNHLFHIFADGTITIGMLVKSQPESNVAAMRSAMAATVQAEFKDGDGYTVPATSLIVAARPS
jgi:ubiquinone/menaquinone biosynthesis C-methylase UbiE